MDDGDITSESSVTNTAATTTEPLLKDRCPPSYDSFPDQKPRRCRRVSLVEDVVEEEEEQDERPPRLKRGSLFWPRKPRFYPVRESSSSRRPSGYPSGVALAWQKMWSPPRETCWEWMELILPMCTWLKTYPWRTALLPDVIAGCTIAFMVVPQSLSYARLGGLPVQFGLYSALAPVYAYACFGSSRQLAVGPVALVNLLLSTGLSRYLTQQNITPDTNDDYEDIYTRLTIQISFWVGLVYISMGLLRMGFLNNFLSHAVVSGFTTGAAVIIGASQCKYFVGYPIPNSDVIQDIVRHLRERFYLFNYKTFVLGVVSVTALLKMKNLGKHNPKMNLIRAIGPITVTITSILLEVIFDLSSKGIPVVGAIPRKLPNVTVSEWLVPIQDPYDLFMIVSSIAIVGFMESVAIAKKMASHHKYDLDSSMELIGLGMANLTGAMFQSHPVTGSFSRSAVNNEAGAQSGISGIVTATIVLTVLIFLTPVLEKVPLVTLGAIVVSGVLGLLDFDEAKFLWKVDRFDFCVWLVAALGTMFLGVQTGLTISVVVSLLLVFYESAYPHTAILGRLPGTKVYRNIQQYPHAQTYDGVLIVRIDAPFYFANTQNICETLDEYEELAQANLTDGKRIRYIILEMSPVSYIDMSGVHILRIMIQRYKERGIQMCFSNPSVIVMDRFVTSGLVDVIGRDHLFVRIDDAVQWCFRRCSITC